MFESILSLLCRYERIILHRHTCPDGDALGSQIGLKHLILANLPGKEVHMVGDAPGRYAFMEDSAPETLPDEAFSGALAVILDTSAPALTPGILWPPQRHGLITTFSAGGSQIRR